MDAVTGFHGMNIEQPSAMNHVVTRCVNRTSELTARPRSKSPRLAEAHHG